MKWFSISLFRKLCAFPPCNLYANQNSKQMKKTYCPYLVFTVSTYLDAVCETGHLYLQNFNHCLLKDCYIICR